MCKRCNWGTSNELMIKYHDEEWGVPIYDDRLLFAKLILDGAQAGLSWIMILKKRAAFRTAFAGFDPHEIAGWGAAEVELLLQNPGIVRHRGKIEATITNAQAYLKIEAAEGFSDYCWNFVGGAPLQNSWGSLLDVPPQTALSQKFSKNLIFPPDTV